MRKYRLASLEHRADVDLQLFTSVIEAVVREVIPSASVVVEQDSYTVSPAPQKGDAIRIGRKLSRTSLGKYCIPIPKLFSSEVIQEREVTENERKKHYGGHY